MEKGKWVKRSERRGRHRDREKREKKEEERDESVMRESERRRNKLDGVGQDARRKSGRMLDERRQDGTGRGKGTKRNGWD